MGIDIQDVCESVDIVAYAEDPNSAVSGWPTSEGADGGVGGDGREAWVALGRKRWI